ncbi:hypothetical protein A3D88_03525 [Candidatus Peribacteria bacterium RIFCSPHIGHO2_02_FULL_52_16]|nr:MAG: hypothetical protein A2706_04340 [Candidatus Peribacteria bacterium RIFCSPHIGHO2_01_FULL_51_35]OGJ61755.1 MAG: hypothetical protein A3D88_03525 [Candidatus Peribacteria bacterium RIFCSPHIGHO2_02_FULL_52_16]
MPSSSLEHGEQLEQLCDEHWIKYVGTVILATLLFGISLLLFLLAGLSAHHYMWLSHLTFFAGLTLLLFTHHWFFMSLLSELLDSIIITNRRLMRIHFRLIFQEDILEISFDRMKTVDAQKHGLLQNLLHYGTLVFESKLATITLVPHPNRVAHVIQKAMLSR